MWKHEKQNVSDVILKEKQDLVEGQFTCKCKGYCCNKSGLKKKVQM